MTDRLRALLEAVSLSGSELLYAPLLKEPQTRQ